MLEGSEHRLVGMAAVVGRRTCGERGCGWGWMSPFALARLHLSSSLLSCSVCAVPSPRLYLLSWHLPGEITVSLLLEGWFGGVEVEKYW